MKFNRFIKNRKKEKITHHICAPHLVVGTTSEEVAPGGIAGRSARQLLGPEPFRGLPRLPQASPPSLVCKTTYRRRIRYSVHLEV